MIGWLLGASLNRLAAARADVADIYALLHDLQLVSK
jgi:hypothetical protein